MCVGLGRKPGILFFFASIFIWHFYYLSEYNCGPVVVSIWVYKVDTVIDLDELIIMTIEDLEKRGQLVKPVESFKVFYKNSGKFYFTLRKHAHVMYRFFFS